MKRLVPQTTDTKAELVDYARGTGERRSFFIRPLEYMYIAARVTDVPYIRDTPDFVSPYITMGNRQLMQHCSRARAIVTGFVGF